MFVSWFGIAAGRVGGLYGIVEFKMAAAGG
jgi:hypothetical protein